MKHIRLRRISGLAISAALFAAAPFVSAQAQQQHAHVHGQMKLDVAIDGPTVVIDMESPLDNIVGFIHVKDALRRITEPVTDPEAALPVKLVSPPLRQKLEKR